MCSTPALPAVEPRMIRERISQELAELAAKEKDLMDPISRKRSELNRLWNSSLLIHRLPNELLVQIFSHFSDAEAPVQEKNTLLPNLRRGTPSWVGWYGLMLVCRHWRAVFLSNPALWRNVDLNRGIDWVNLCLTRSASASIHVYARRHGACPLEVLHRHTHQFKTFRLDAGSGDPESPHSKTALAPLLKDRMPLLEDLNLNFNFNFLRPQVDAHLTSQRLPSLRTLVLCDVVAPQDTSLFTQLRALSLYRCSFAHSFDAFLDTLAASVQLEELDLRTALCFPSEEWLRGGPTPHRSPVSLPRLRKLALGAHGIVRTSRFLAHLYIPPSATLSIEGDHGLEISDAGVAHSTIGAMLPPNRSDTLPILAIVTELDMTICDDEYQISCDSVSSQDAVSEGFPQARFVLSTYDSDDPDWDPFMPESLADLVECFGRSPLKRLSVTGDHASATVGAWSTVFRTFEHLEELIVGGSAHTRVTDVFYGLFAASMLPEDLPVACPNLKRIEVAGLGEVETYAVMLECFQYRSDQGVVLQVLDLTSMPNAEGFTSELRDTVIEAMSKVVECIETSCSAGETDDEQDNEGQV